MTNIKNLEIVKAALGEKKQAILDQFTILDEEFKAEKKALMDGVFVDELTSYPEVKIEAIRDSVYFNVDGREIGSLNRRYSWDKRDDVYYFNTYSTMIDTEFEYKRLIFNGKLAEKILFNQESILAALKTPFSKEEEVEALREELYAIEAEMRNQNEQMNRLRKEEVMTKLMGEGMEYQPGHAFEFNRQWSSSQIKKVRIVEATKSGKTVTLEVTYVRYKWIDDENGGSMRVSDEDAVVTYEKIRMDYVMGNFRNYIYK